MAVPSSMPGGANPKRQDPAARASVGAEANLVGRRQWTRRYGRSGLHLFERVAGMNILLDEISVPRARWSRAPRQVSIALTNRCDLACGHCYAPKSRDELRYDDVTRWIEELDSNGCLGVGFGGGEPTLFPQFAELCQYTAGATGLAVTFTTHGHHLTELLAERLRGSVHFIRISMDGVGATYEAIRRRPFSDLRRQLERARSIAPFGINVVVNEATVPDLDRAATVAEAHGASELLLLPQATVGANPGIDAGSMRELQRWVERYEGSLRLTISESHAEGFPTCDPLPEDRGIRAYAHIDARGTLRASSFHATGVRIGVEELMEAVTRLSSQTEEDDA